MNRGIVKIIGLIIFVGVAIYAIRYTPVSQYISPDALGGLVASAGIWAPLVFILIYTVGVCMFVPGTILTSAGGIIFGPWWGFLWVWIGAMLGAAASFIIGRTLGREFAASLIGDRLKKYDDAIERNGFATVLYLRLIYTPFTPMNFGMGLTRVRFWDYWIGTGLGILVGTFIFVFLIGTLKEVWMSGNWGELWSPRVLFSAGLFIFSFFIPIIIKKFKKENTLLDGKPPLVNTGPGPKTHRN